MRWLGDGRQVHINELAIVAHLVLQAAVVGDRATAGKVREIQEVSMLAPLPPGGGGVVGDTFVDQRAGGKVSA